MSRQKIAVNGLDFAELFLVVQFTKNIQVLALTVT
jgi:hypothetical protein